jgi:putative DNA primase/helicase
MSDPDIDSDDKVVNFGPKRKPQTEPWDRGAPPPKPRRRRSGLGPVDDGIAEAFAEKHRNDLRYVAAWGKWYEWRDGCWREEKTLRVFDLIRALCRERGIERARMSAMVAAVHSLARADRRLAATIEQWDANPMLLNTPDGVVDLRTGELRAHRPGDYMTMIAAVGPRGDCPKWKAFLRRITKDDEALIGFLQRVAGYCATADTGEQAMFFGYGVGANGKGVFLQTIGRVLGDYCKTAAIETFTESKTDRHPTELARLHSARLVTATETESGRNWAESRLKMLTGGDTVTAHFMRQDDFEYVPKFKPFFTGNHKPGLRSVGEAMRRRVKMIPFDVVIPPEERDPHFMDSLKGEWPGILQWMIDGCIDWLEHGLDPPESVTKTTDAYFEAQDSFTLWVDECCERDRNAWAESTPLFGSWKAWAEKAGVRYGNVQEFRERMETSGFVWKRKGVRQRLRGPADQGRAADALAGRPGMRGPVPDNVAAEAYRRPACARGACKMFSSGTVRHCPDNHRPIWAFPATETDGRPLAERRRLARRKVMFRRGDETVGLKAGRRGFGHCGDRVAAMTDDYLMRLVQARCPELSGQPVALAVADTTVPAEVFLDVMRVVDALGDRIAAIEARLDERAG